MTDSHKAPVYPDQAMFAGVVVSKNVKIARGTFSVQFDCPDIARQILPGQFVMVRLAGCDDPLLGRPLALYDTVLSPSGDPVGLELVYLVLGKMTTRLSLCVPGQRLEVWGPLGNGFPPTDAEHLIMVAGGIGQTPFLALARECLGKRAFGDSPRRVPRIPRVSLCYGTRTADLLAGVDDFSAMGVTVLLATEDGTAGHRGLVTDLLPRLLAEDQGNCCVVCCGPEPMLKRVAELTSATGVACQVSLETPMACGIGICFSCVAKVLDETGSWDYKRTCIEGPVFDARRIEW